MDLTRDIFDPGKRYAAVVAQQGRVTTDDDLNEGHRIALEEQRRRTVDTLGPAGTPDDGFAVSAPRDAGGSLDLTVGAGTYYAGGVRVSQQTSCSYLDQPDWSDPDHVAVPGTGWLAYLEVTHQEVSAQEDAELLEPALGGVDTTGRLRTMWRVRVAEVGLHPTCAGAWEALTAHVSAAHEGTIGPDGEITVDTRLTVDVDPASTPDLCSPSAPGFTGAENQLLRVQLTPGGFTWGYDNASPLTPVVVVGTVVTLQAPPRDVHHQPRRGQVVELLPPEAVLSNGRSVAARSGHLTTVTSPYDPATGEITVAAAPGFPVTDAAGDPLPVLLRVWNRGDDVTSAPELPTTTGGPVPLGATGLTVTFGGTDRVTGDHWLVAARPEAPSVVVPWRLHDGTPPHGPRRWVAPLARIRPAATGYTVHDCRTPLRTLADTPCCAVDVCPDTWLTVIDHLLDDTRPRDLVICFGPGQYHLPDDREVVFRHHRSVRLTGAGRGTVLHAGTRETLIGFAGVEHVTVEGLTMLLHGRAARSLEGHAGTVSGVLDVRDARTAHVRRVTARSLAAPRAAMACVVVAGRYNREGPGADVVVEHCTLAPGANQVGVLLLDTERAVVEHNVVGRSYGLRMKQGHLEEFLDDPRYRRRLNRLAFRDPRPAPSSLFSDETEVTVGAARISFRSFAGAGAEVADVLTARAGGSAVAGRGTTELIAFARGLLSEPFRPGSPLPGLRDRLRANRPPVAAVGVLVAGRRADSTRVTGNDILDTRSGVVVALSDSKAERGAQAAGERVPSFSAGRVHVADNLIRLVVTVEGFGLPHRGVQVGHARTVQVTGNDIAAEHKGLTGELRVPTDGVRLWGRFGARLAVTDNQLTGLMTGVLARTTSGAHPLLRDNTFDGVAVEVDLP